MNLSPSGGLRSAHDPRRCDRAPAPAAGGDDPELEDLIYSWRRLPDNRARRIALQVIRALAS